MRPGRRCLSGFGLVEVIVGLLVIGLVSVSVVGLLRSFIQIVTFVPNAARVSQASSELLTAIVEGSVTQIAGAPAPALKGLRFTKRVDQATTTIQSAQDNEVQFYGPGSCEAVTASCLIRIRLVGATLWRSYDTLPGPGIAWSAEERVPYYSDEEGIQVAGAGPSWQLFQYFDASDNATTVLGNIRRVVVAAQVQTGTGASDGRVVVTSSIAIRFY